LAPLRKRQRDFDVVRQNMHAIRKSSATDDIDPALLSCAERKRWRISNTARRR
jgi:hypothetical protein